VITGIAFSQDGTTMMTGATDGTFRRWDVTGNTLRPRPDKTIQVSAAIPHTLVISPAGNIAITAMEDHTIALWDLDSGMTLHTFAGHTDTVTGVAFSPDGTRMLSGSRDGTLRLWDVEHRQLLRIFVGDREGVSSVAFSPDGTTALSGSLNGRVRLWDVERGLPLREFASGSHGWVNVAFHPDGRTVLTTADDGSVRLWRLDPVDTLLEWVRTHRVVPELTCDQRAVYHVQPLCASDAVQPTPTPTPSPAPTVEPQRSPTDGDSGVSQRWRGMP
jgi:WD40 repeat protein